MAIESKLSKHKKKTLTIFVSYINLILSTWFMLKYPRTIRIKCIEKTTKKTIFQLIKIGEKGHFLWIQYVFSLLYLPTVTELSDNAYQVYNLLTYVLNHILCVLAKYLWSNTIHQHTTTYRIILHKSWNWNNGKFQTFSNFTTSPSHSDYMRKKYLHISHIFWILDIFDFMLYIIFYLSLLYPYYWKPQTYLLTTATSTLFFFDRDYKLP